MMWLPFSTIIIYIRGDSFGTSRAILPNRHDHKTMNIKRILRLGALVIGIVLIGLYIVLPVGMGVSAVLPAKAAVGSPPAGFDEITLQTDDHETLAAWYKPPANGAVIILTHGAGGSREGVRPYAEMLVRHGYGVLALDLRGHGMSSGKTNRLGWSSTLDVGAAIQYLQGRSEVKHVGGLGLSMGAEVLLGATSAYPSLKAVVADGATRRCLDELLALPTEQTLFRNFTARVMYATVQVLSAEAPPKPLLSSMLEAPATRFLWVAGGANSLEVAFNQLFADTVGARGALWVASEAVHTGAFGRYPDEYERRVIDFLDSALLNKTDL